MKCPFCDQDGTRTELHAHMVSAHKDSLQTRHDEDRMFFDVNCPLCAEGMTREVNPRGRDQAFLEMGRSGTVERMAPHLTHMGVHDHGFNNVSTYGTLWRLARERRFGRRDPAVRIVGAREHNLVDLTVRFPLGRLVGDQSAVPGAGRLFQEH